MRLLPDQIAHPWLLPLLLAAFLPIVLHILDRRRAKPVDWPALRFLVLGSRSRMRRWRLREALLILVRSCVALLVGYAALGPITRETIAVKASGVPRVVAVVIDASWSMAYRETPDGPRSLDRAREAALAVIDTLDPASSVALVATGRPAPAGGWLLDAAQARRAIRELEPAPGGFGLLESLDRAAELLARATLPAREIYVLTDLQEGIVSGADRRRWGFLSERLRALVAGRPGDLTVRLVDCGAVAPSNRFVSVLVPPALAVPTDEPVRMGATLEVSGALRGAAREDGPASSAVEARLLEGGLEVGSTVVALPGDDPVAIEMPHRFREAGPARVEVAMPPDGLRDDDARRCSLEVLDRIDVLVSGPTSRGAASGTDRQGPRSPRHAADYVDLALLPRLPGTPVADALFRPTLEEELGGSDLATYRVIVLAGPRRIPGAVVERLEAFVTRGGGLLVFTGPDIDPAAWSNDLWRGGRGILPACPREGRGAAIPSTRPREIALAHPALSIFSGGDEGDLTATSIRSWTRVSELSPDAAVLARIDDESPWLLERRVGEGRVILVTTSAAPDDSDLPLTPLFLPLVHRLTRYLAGTDADRRNVELGEPIVLDVPAGSVDVKARVNGPDGKERPVSLELEAGGLRAVCRDADVPGFYELQVERPDGRPVASGLFAVNVPQGESRLERLSPRVLEEIDPTLGIRVVRSVGEVLGMTLAEERSREQWPSVLAVLVLLALAEVALARGFAGRPE